MKPRNSRSIGTSKGMQWWYFGIPTCTSCKKTKCVRYPQRDIKTCAGCFKKITGLNIKETFRNAKGSYKDRVQWLKTLIST